MKASHLGLLLALNCGWAAVPTIATLAKGQLSVLQFVFLRYAFALAALALLWPWLPGRLPRGSDFWKTCAMGVAVFTLGHLLQIAGIQLGHASDSSLLLAVDPLVSSLGAAIFLHERIPPRRWTGFALAIVGVAMISLGRPAGSFPSLAANLLLVLSFVSEAAWSVMGKPLIQRWGILKVTALALAAGTLANTLLMVPAAGHHASALAAARPETLAILALLGIVFTAGGYSAWYLVIREAPVSAASMTIYLQPVVGLLLALTLTGELLHLGHWIGSLAILAGLVVGLAGASASRPLVLPEK